MQLVELYNPLAPSTPTTGIDPNFYSTPIQPLYDPNQSLLTPLFGDTSTSAWQSPGGQWNYSFIAGTPDTTSGTSSTSTSGDPLLGGISYTGGGGGLVPLSPTYADPGTTQTGTTVPGTTQDLYTVPGYTQQAPTYDLYGNPIAPSTGTSSPTGDPSSILPFTFDQNGNPIPTTTVPTSGTGGSGAQVPTAGDLLTRILGGNLPNQSMQFPSSPFPGMTDLLSGQTFDQLHGPNLQIQGAQQSGPLWNITPGGQNPIMGMQPQQGGGQSPGAQALPQQAPPMPNAPPLQLDRRALPGGALAPGRPPMPPVPPMLQGGVNEQGNVIPGIGAIAAGAADGVTPTDVGSALNSIGNMPVPFPRPRIPMALPDKLPEPIPPPPAQKQESPIDKQLMDIFAGSIQKMHGKEQMDAIQNYAQDLAKIDNAPPSEQLQRATHRLKAAQQAQAQAQEALNNHHKFGRPYFTDDEIQQMRDPGYAHQKALAYANSMVANNPQAQHILGGRYRKNLLGKNVYDRPVNDANRQQLLNAIDFHYNDYKQRFLGYVKANMERYKSVEEGLKADVLQANKAVDDAQQDLTDAENRAQEQKNFDKDIAKQRYEMQQNRMNAERADTAVAFQAGKMLQDEQERQEKHKEAQQRIAIQNQRAQQGEARLAQAQKEFGFRQERADMQDYFKAQYLGLAEQRTDALMRLSNSPDRAVRNYAISLQSLPTTPEMAPVRTMIEAQLGAELVKSQEQQKQAQPSWQVRRLKGGK